MEVSLREGLELAVPRPQPPALLCADTSLCLRVPGGTSAGLGGCQAEWSWRAGGPPVLSGELFAWNCWSLQCCVFR